MKKKVQLEEITGKTVEGFAFSFDNHELLISFKDDTFIVVGFVEGFHEGDDGITDVEFDIFDFYSDDLVNNISDSSEELLSIKEGTRDRTATLAEIAERETYARLKAKYDVV